MELHVIAVGKIRDPAVRDACDMYAKRLRRRQRLHVVEVKEAGRRAATPQDARRFEAASLLRAMPERARGVALTRDGAPLTSRQLAEHLASWRLVARDVAFLIGGAHGLALDLIGRCELTLSLSALTLPHEMARLVLLEQLYRAETILRGEPYHKGEA
ncbi:MAG TPA: 23S rRNA (pseudouridine(1915)-N(3))-methyltransferase RlmH [Gemmatimonadales bacterium]|jgi:23S rRNA (pseudouridine1915-N3)-methyltransferase